MTDAHTQALEFIALLEEAGLKDERIDYYVDKLAEGTFDVAELENELTENASELEGLVRDGTQIASEMETDFHADDAHLSTEITNLGEDYNAEMAATVLGAKAEADDMEKSFYQGTEAAARKSDADTISKIKQFLKRKK